jgi:hypothetical protein
MLSGKRFHRSSSNYLASTLDTYQFQYISNEVDRLPLGNIYRNLSKGVLPTPRQATKTAGDQMYLMILSYFQTCYTHAYPKSAHLGLRLGLCLLGPPVPR